MSLHHSYNSDSGSGSGSVVQREVLYKFLVLGDYGVGKTALVRRYTEDRFTSNYKITIGADFSMKSFSWDNETRVNLQLWDIAGQERFGGMTRIYYKYAVAAIIVFDLTRSSTFHSVEKWLGDLRAKVSLQDDEPIPVVLLANKCDIEGIIIQDELINEFCSDNEIGAWFVTSAKENINIDDSVSYLVEQVLYLKAQEARKESIILLDAWKCDGKQQNKYISFCCS